MGFFCMVNGYLWYWWVFFGVEGLVVCMVDLVIGV